MKLTSEQVEYVSDYVKSFDIKWYELQVELTDHMILCMEEIWTNDLALTFHQVKHYAENNFGRNGFKTIEKERTAILKKEYRQNQWKILLQYLKFPKIIISVLLGIFFYMCSFYFENKELYIRLVFTIFIIINLVHTIIWANFRKNGFENILALEMKFRINNGVLFGFTNIWFFSKYFSQTNYGLLIACVLFTVGVLFVVTSYQSTTNLIERVKKQYQLN